MLPDLLINNIYLLQMKVGHENCKSKLEQSPQRFIADAGK